MIGMLLRCAGMALLFAGATYCLSAAVSDGTATRRAAQGEGRTGTFVAERRNCPKMCAWYGSFQAPGAHRAPGRDFELRGATDGDIATGQRVQALDVGSRDFVYARGGPPEWDITFSRSMGALFLATLGTALLTSTCRTLGNRRR
ncbi:hypothetical protein [Spirillospora sp. NPDC047279]|uniref:hypothetical protein n=1 Tax=Spirillospora sp. NPDC047279 TaxID=3155478 RepID=UPI0033D133C5